jgi:outer membrane protein OmpA-like peptidoglycan-associated protein
MDINLRAPSSITEERKLVELFPLRNYIFFQDGSTALPAKYVRLSPAQASGFDERNLLTAPVTGTSASQTTRSQRQMGVYYNALNVFGERLQNTPGATIELVGSAPSQADGLQMANDVKNYLVSTFGIDAGRISTKGQIRPPHESGTRATPQEDLDLVAEENRRVEVLSNNLAILRPVEIETIQSDPVDNDLVLGVNSVGAVDSWTVNVTGEGFNQTFGPYRETTQRIDGKQILGDRASGNYTATVTARTPSGKTVTKTSNFTLSKLEMPPMTGQRFSILFEFDESKTVQTYEQFLRSDVAPRIPAGATVVVHGHTDKVGEEDYNIDLSNRRAAETQRVLQSELQKLGRSVTFDSYGFGETEMRAPFDNSTPEGRYYDRTVLIEVIPAQ